jgi:hypothetical protein
MKSKGPKIDPWGNPCFAVPHFQENSCDDFILFFFSVRSDLNQLGTIPGMP